MLHVFFNVGLIFLLIGLIALVSYTSRRYNDMKGKIDTTDTEATHSMELLRTSKHQILIIVLIIVPLLLVGLVLIKPAITFVCYVVTLNLLYPCIMFRRELTKLK